MCICVSAGTCVPQSMYDGQRTVSEFGPYPPPCLRQDFSGCSLLCMLGQLFSDPRGALLASQHGTTGVLGLQTCHCIQLYMDSEHQIEVLLLSCQELSPWSSVPHSSTYFYQMSSWCSSVLDASGSQMAGIPVLSPLWRSPGRAVGMLEIPYALIGSNSR